MLGAMKIVSRATLVALLAAGVSGCAGSVVARSLCEGLQLRARVVDPLADPKTSPDRATCAEYEAERGRLNGPERR